MRTMKQRFLLTLGALMILSWMILSCGSPADRTPAGTTVTLSNLSLPTDTAGHDLVTGEASVLLWGGAYYVYFNDWGGCPGVNCCASLLGCADCCFDPPSSRYPDTCVYANGHTVVVYRTTDFRTWEPMGVALPLANRKDGIVFRPRVVYRASSRTFLMWYEDRWEGQMGYAIAESATPEGPFITIADSVTLHGTGRPGDFDLFVDDDGTAYHVRTGIVIERLTGNFTAGTGDDYSLSLPLVEAPVMFKRSSRYYLLVGVDCCACAGGSNILVYTADHPLGPFIFQSEVGSNPTPFNIHVPDHYVTGAQGTDVIRVPSADGLLQFLWLGNQWVTAAGAGQPRDHDLLYWSVLRFDADGQIQHLVRQDAATLSLPCSACGR
jgi:Glycosyl hydrolases family 43